MAYELPTGIVFLFASIFVLLLTYIFFLIDFFKGNLWAISLIINSMVFYMAYNYHLKKKYIDEKLS